ncbi:MAG: acyl-CoA dehydrogenase, partial [Solirubrobacterales bacterium]
AFSWLYAANVPTAGYSLLAAGGELALAEAQDGVDRPARTHLVVHAGQDDVEQHYRDNRLNAIHEGTHGIQGMDLLGRKVTMEGGAALALLAERMNETIAQAREGGGEAAQFADALEASLARLVEVTGTIWGQGDIELALANASLYLEAAGHVVMAWIWLQQYLVAAGDDDFHEGKRQAARYFFRWELPRTAPQFDLLATLDRTTLDMEQAWF